MATLQEQVEQSVQKYNENADKVHKFVNGTDSESIESETGLKPSIAKMVKDTQDTISGLMTDINDKVQLVENDRVYIEQTKADTEQIKDDTQNMLTDFENTHLPAINAQLAQHTSDIAANTVKGEETVIWSGNVGNGGVVTLSQAYDSFTQLLFEYSQAESLGFMSEKYMSTSQFTIGEVKNLHVHASHWVSVTPTSTSEISVTATGGLSVTKIIGVK